MQNEILQATLKLANKAKDTQDSQDAIRFSQAALNLAHTLATFKASSIVCKISDSN